MFQDGEWTSQLELASALGITTRRVRQLIDSRILPRDREGKWHLPTCSERYRVFTHKTERDLDAVAYDVEQRVNQLHDLLKELVEAENDKLRRELLPKAVELHRETFEALAFMMATWSKSEPERALVLRLVDCDARDAFATIWRATQIVIGHERGINPDLVFFADTDENHQPFASAL